jgi:hypothetical protein
LWGQLNYLNRTPVGGQAIAARSLSGATGEHGDGRAAIGAYLERMGASLP